MKAKLKTPLPEAPLPLTLPRFGAGAKLLVFPLCVLAPGAGVALGLLYGRQEDKAARRFGYLCLGLGILGALARLSRGGQGGFNSADTLTQPFY